jgi:hypothetical protein
MAFALMGIGLAAYFAGYLMLEEMIALARSR